jgi:3-phenylpropionate/trans-cinnamate dioxygenase ferredoxin reductase component
VSGVLIAGAGLAGARCAERLRSGGHQGPIRMVGEEPVPPYRRPALSKELLAGTAGLGELRLRSPGWWDEAGIELALGRRIEWIDVERRRATLQGGSELDWDTLVVATGSRARILPGLAPARGMHSLRSFQDALALRNELRPGRRIVVIGAGFVGTEVASTALGLGVEVTLVDPSPPLSRVLGQEVSALLAARYREHGIDLRTGAALERLDVAEGRVRGVFLADGNRVACDALLVAVGAEPAVPAGLPSAAEGGIATDSGGRTCFDGVYACGDVARSMHPLLGRHVRVEHWSDAAAQGTAVAETILGIESVPRGLPLFWSDQFGLRLQYVGHATEWSRVELDGGPDEFRALYLDCDGRPLAALVANRPRELGRLRRELADALPRAA